MSYLVLARKWRPKDFSDTVGQEHVLRALMNALESGRLHHAYLFAGTRGVGKTTLARLLAKALNCEQGVASEPCGECATCLAIDEGRFVDLIEVDAASRTKVDDTRELLDNVQYMPTQGRFKVYLIDEVHMLSNHSFNALLKTLEEPPPHVKFLFATTDPQKLPITVLSRCLQFNLKKLTQPQITEQLTKICAAEQIAVDDEALKVIARAADGSMRDALSLLDQAIAFGAGKIELAEITAMLGTIDRSHVLRLLEALGEQDGEALLEEVERLDARAPSYVAVLDELMSALQRIAVVQLVAGRLSDDDPQALQTLAEQLAPEDVQLYYQIALHGRRDMAWCRDERVGFEMTLLRMLAFRPVEEGATSVSQRAAPVAPKRRAAAVRDAATASAVNGANAPAASVSARSAGGTAADDSPARPAPAGAEQRSAESALRVVGQKSPESPPAVIHEPSSEPLDGGDWQALIRRAELRGAARRLADHCEVVSSTARRIELVLVRDKADFNTEQVRERIQSALSECLGRDVKITIKPGDPPRPTPAERRIAGENARMRAARETIEADPNVKAVQAAFDAVVEADSIHPMEDSKEVEQ